MASKKNIYTGAVVALAAALAIAAALIKTGAFRSRPKPTADFGTVEESAVVLASETDVGGGVTYYTMLTRYVRPKVSSHHVYPARETTVQTEESTPTQSDERTTYVQATDENGKPLFDENGEPITQVLRLTAPETAEGSEESTTEYVPKTAIVELTNIFGKPHTDKNGAPLTLAIPLESPRDVWSRSSSSGASSRFDVDIGVEPQIKSDDNLARAIFIQLNRDRKERGLKPLAQDPNLTALARTNGMARALPGAYKVGAIDGRVSDSMKKARVFETDYGGIKLYNEIFARVEDEAMSEKTERVGVGVVKYKDVYYTAVIFA